MESNLHIVSFDMYCPSCKNVNKSQNEEPCDTCLSIPAREDSRKPEKWEENDGCSVKRRTNRCNK